MSLCKTKFSGQVADLLIKHSVEATPIYELTGQTRHVLETRHACVPSAPASFLRHFCGSCLHTHPTESYWQMFSAHEKTSDVRFIASPARQRRHPSVRCEAGTVTSGLQSNVCNGS